MKKDGQNMKNPYYKLFLILYLVGFFLGILFSNFAWRVRPNSVDIVSLDLIASYPAQGITSLQLFLYLLSKRLEGILLYILMGITVLGIPFVWGGLLWYGFLGGSLYTMFILQLGLKGIWSCTLVLIPQILIYIPILGLLYYEVYRMSEFSWGRRREERAGYRKYAGKVGVLLVIYIIGVFTEAYINPIILKFIK